MKYERISSSDETFAYTHLKELTITVQCGDCGIFIPFKIDSHGGDIRIQTYTHKCKEVTE